MVVGGRGPVGPGERERWVWALTLCWRIWRSEGDVDVVVADDAATAAAAADVIDGEVAVVL